jgi:hypothetical protein
MLADRRRRIKRRTREDLPIEEEIAYDLMVKYPFIKNMVERFELEII